MKLFLKFLVFISLNTFSQTGIVYYTKAFNKSKNIQNIDLIIFNNIKYKLLFNVNTAKMEIEKNMNLDDLSTRRFAYKGGGKGVYY